MSTLREVSNLTTTVGDPKLRQTSRYVNSTASSQENYGILPRGIGSGSYASLNSQSSSFASTASDNLAPNAGRPTFGGRLRVSPQVDARHADKPAYCTDLIQDITESFLDGERRAVRRFNEGTAAHMSNTSRLYSYYPSAHYLRYQPEMNEKMRLILVDWLLDVHLKFKLHPETMYLCVNIIDRYLSCVNTKHKESLYVPRAQLQLLGVSAMLIAAKYEEIWPPEVKDCVTISANTYTREEVVTMERNICAALSFRLTVPTAYPFAARLLTVLDGVDFLGIGRNEELRREHLTTLRHATGFYLEHALLDYNCLQFTPSQVGNAAVFLALLTLRIKLGLPNPPRTWDDVMLHYSKAELREFRGCAEAIMEFVNYVPTTKYHAIRRKYNSSRYGEISKLLLPSELPLL